MAITFLDEEEDIVAATEPPKGGGGITFLDEEVPTAPTQERPKITFLDEEPEAKTPAPVGTSFIEELAAIPQAIKQSIDQPLEAMGETAEVLGASGLGGTLRGAIEGPEDYVPASQRFMEPQEGEFQVAGFAPQFLPRAIVEQAGQIGGAILTRAGGMAIGGLAGSALGPKGTAAGAVAGAFIGPALFEMGQIVGPVARERAANQGREEPTTDDLAWAWATAGASGALNAVGAKYIPGGDKLTGSLAKRISTAIAGEGSTEGAQAVVQQTGQTFLTEQGFEIKPKEIVGETIIGGGAGGAAVAATAPFTKAAAAAETKVVAEQVAPIAPETAQAVSEQANQVMQEAQADENAETPEQRVARLQEEATAAAGIELEEEVPVSGLPPQPVTPTEGVTGTTASVPVMITRKMEADLLSRGLTQEQVNAMTPQEANDMLAQPVPTAEGAVAPVEPVVEPVSAEPQPAAIVPAGTKEEQDLSAAQERVKKAQEVVDRVRDLPEDNPEVMAAYTERTESRNNLIRSEVAVRHPNSKNISSEERAFLAPLQELAPLRPDEEPLTEGKKWRKGEEVGYNENVGTITKAIPPEGQSNVLYRVVTKEDYERILAAGQIDSDMRGAITPDEGINLTPKTATAAYYLPRGETGVIIAIDTTGLDLNFIQSDSYVRSFKPIPADKIVGRSDFIHKDAETGDYLLRPQDNDPVTNEPASIVNYTKAAPTPKAAPTATPPVEVAPETPNLEPLRRVARAEQAPEDVPSLVDAGLVEVYKDQPVLTEAGIALLPEAERPRLNPEARKIQIDTGSNEVVAEAIAKGLRIGVDQVGFNVRMPAGWTLDGDIYVPPTPQEVAPETATFAKGEMVRVTNRVPTYEGGRVVGGRDELVAGSVTRIMPDGKVEVRLQRGGYQTLAPNEVQKIERPAPEARESRREPSVEMRQQYAPKTEEEQASFDKASSNKVLARSPQLAVAAVRMKNGEITAGEYADLVDAIDPFTAKGADPIPTNEKIYQYMSKTMGASPNTEEGRAKIQKIGAAITSGKVVEFRIDIPTYNESTKAGDTVYSVTAHEPVSETAKQVGKTISHLGIAKVTNPTFMNRAISGKGAAVAIAAGAGKFPLATVKGNYEPITDLPADINDPNVWTEAGYNPIRSSFFVDTRSKDAVVGGSEAIMVGSRVFVKDAVLEPRPTGVTMGERYAKIQMPRPAGMETEAVATKLESLGFGRGGIVSVVNEPDASFEGRTIIRDGKVVGIELNAAALKDDAAVERVLNHEIAESANADGALNALVAGLTPKERKEINDAITRLGYAEKARTAEEAARAVELLAEGWRGRKWFDRAVARVEAWANKLGYKLTRRAAEYIAARNMAEVNDAFRKRTIADALANLKGARRVDFNGLSAVLIPPSEMGFAYSIAAYHGTPHEIKGRFLTSKIGTGEGATAYGWGLYFAENVEVAKEYRERLSRGQYALIYKGVPVHELPSQQKNVILKLVAGIPKETIVGDLESSLRRQEESKPEDWAVPENRERVIADLKEEIEIAREIEKSNIKPRSAGNLYTVEIDVNPEELFDWDKTFPEQNEKVKTAIRNILGDDVVDFILKSTNKNRNGGWFYEMIGGSTDAKTEATSKKAASELLFNNGINGIKYLDQGSRDAGEGSSNFVIFDENLIKITARNGREIDIRESRREDAIPTFSEGSPEASTLSNMKESMAKVDAASEGKPNPENKPTYKISEIASVWMDQGGDIRQLQDLISENTNLTPTNAAKVANAIAKQYDIQQSIATAFIETQTGLSVEALPEGVTLPKEVDPDRPKPVMSRLFDVFMGVRVPPVKIQVNEKAALKDQIRLKAAANRAAKAEQKRTAEEVVEIIKAMELLGPVRPKQVQALAKRAARVIWTSEKSVEAFSEYAAKVVENTNYDADLREAKDAQKRAKQLSTQKKVAMGPQREVLGDISKIPVNKLDDPRMFAEAVNYYLRGFKAVLSPDYVVIPDAEMESYLSGAQSETQRNQRDLDREANERLAKKYGIESDQVNEMMESIDIIKQIEAQENREALDNLLTEKAVETQQGLREYNTDNLRSEQRPIVSSMLKVDPKALDPEERQRFIRITNNIIYNNQTNGAEYFVAVAKGQQSAREAAQDSEMIAKNRAWINLLPRFVSERMQRGWALELQSVADTFRNAFGKGAMAKVYDAMGMLDLNLGFTKANNTIDEIQKKIAEFHRGIEKKYKETARNQDGLLAEGIVGFLIQSIPKKDELASINQRRDLIRQDIANRRRSSAQPDRIAMADRIETILNQIDGDSVEAILNNMKRDFPPNYESLIWYKDTLLPQYKDFLKNFDENFNDQANNYDNPNYLTIGFTSAGPSLTITNEEQGLFYSQVSLNPKQSAYTIKRVDYSVLPKDPTTKRSKEIEFNLRRNVFNGLSDQINKAYTSSGWQRIASFMKTPEAETVFGGAANKDFFIERLNRLRLSRMRRGSMGSGGAIEKAVDSLSIISRKLGTGIALGGIYQWIKQPPDQLITAWGSGGRGDLLAKNIAPKTQKLARTLLNKFSIGRRGDASAGYKYINQMEGHQNRLERYFSESKWDQAKEQAGNIADVWMVALKSSDFLAASAAWMTYYEGELNKQNIKIDDWSKEADLIESDPARRQAAAFAEQMTDIYQGSSDPTSMATFAQSGKTGWENFVKAIFVPFNSFAIQQRMRLYSDARDALNGSKSGVGGLSGTIGGLILFHTTKRYVIPAISGVGIGVLYGLMGVDMDEPDEEKQKEEANKNWRQFLADLTGNLLVGGTPQIVESQFIDAMNRASYLVSLQLEIDSILNDKGEIMSYDQYSKERSPFYRYKSYDNAMSLGMLDIGMGQVEQVALQTKMLASPEEMEMYTPEEQRLLYFSALSEWLLLMRLNDTDFARLVGKARRDMIKAAEDREKAIKAIRSGR